MNERTARIIGLEMVAEAGLEITRNMGQYFNNYPARDAYKISDQVEKISRSLWRRASKMKRNVPF